MIDSKESMALHGIIFAITGIFLHILGISVYRLTFHPLSKYPGPLLGRITDWYSVYHAYKGDRHLDFYDLHQQYGKIVRYGPNRISICSNTALKAIHGFNANTRKSDWYRALGMPFDVENVFTTTNRETHAVKKRIISQALSPGAIRYTQDHILKNARILCSKLIDTSDLREWSRPKNMSEWINFAVSDTISDLCFGCNLNLLQSSENRDFLQTFVTGIGALHIAAYMPWILNFQFDLPFLKKYVNRARRFLTVTKAQANTRIVQEHNGVEHKDIVSGLLKARDSTTGKCFTTPELVSEAIFLLIAGSDTSRVVITSTIFYCLCNPGTLELLEAEVRTVFDCVEDICIGQRLDSCYYLRACIDESMRLSPPVGAVMPRQALLGGVQVDGHFFPEGTELGVPVYALHHQERYHPNAFTFKPARWGLGPLGAASEESVSLSKSAFCPFGIGPRSCAGKALAYTEISLLLARIVFLFDLRLSQNSRAEEGRSSWAGGRKRKNEFHVFDSVVALHNGPMVEFKRRD